MSTAPATEHGSILDLGHTGLPAAEDTTYVLPMGHFGSGFDGLNPPFHSKRHHGVRGTNNTISNLRQAFDDSCQQHLAMAPLPNPYTPTQPPLIDAAMPDNVNALEGLGDHSPSPFLGGPILSPQQNKDHTQGVSWFEVEQLVALDYHRKKGGVMILTAGFLKNAGIT